MDPILPRCTVIDELDYGFRGTVAPVVDSQLCKKYRNVPPPLPSAALGISEGEILS